MGCKSIVDKFQTGNNKNISYIANELLKMSFDQIPVEIIKICKALGFFVYQQELPEDVYGYIRVDGMLKSKLGTDKVISVDKFEQAKTRRMIVAYELGMFLLNFDPNKQIQFDDIVPKKYMEHKFDRLRPGHQFALELLTPKDKIVSLCNKLSQLDKTNYDIIQELSDFFLIPPTDISLRIQTLGFCQTNKYPKA